MTSGTTTVAGYLLTPLAQAGVRSVFGVPGEDNLGLLDAIEAARPTMEWMGTATEQGAAYAAGGYARQRGLSAVVPTFGAGEVSVLKSDRRRVRRVGAGGPHRGRPRSGRHPAAADRPDARHRRQGGVAAASQCQEKERGWRKTS